MLSTAYDLTVRSAAVQDQARRPCSKCMLQLVKAPGWLSRGGRWDPSLCRVVISGSQHGTAESTDNLGNGLEYYCDSVDHADNHHLGRCMQLISWCLASVLAKLA